MNYIFYLCIVFFSIFQNISLGKQIGKLGNSIIPLIIIIILIYFLVIKKRIYINKFLKKFKNLIIYLFGVNVVSIIIFIFFKGGNYSILGENIIIKSIKGYIYILLIFILMLEIFNLIENMNLKQILNPFFITFNFLFLSLIFEIKNPILFNSIFHQSTYNRIRLFTSESSFTGTLIVIYGLMSLIYCIKYKRNFIFINILMIGVFISSSGSKGLVLTIILSGIFILLLDKIKYYYKIIFGIIILLGAIILLPNIFDSLSNDIENYTSIATRGYTILISLISLFKYPFGVGNCMYLVTYPKLLEEYIYIVWQKGLNISEINSYIFATTDTNIAAKSGVTQYGLYWGIVGSFLFFSSLSYIYISIKENEKGIGAILMYIYVFIIISIVSYIDFDIKYEIWIFMCIAYRFKIKEKEILEDTILIS